MSLADKLKNAATGAAEDVGKKIISLQQEVRDLYLKIKALDAS